jgi:DNA polymerase elongation subunit (family B)
MSHYLNRVSLNIDLMDKQDLLRRTAESARLNGIDFFSALTRGSQYRVEAMLFRIAHRLGYIAPSPSRLAVARQAPMEKIPIVFEPQASMYCDPVLVLDFQSLYPSLIIAYNMCYSTICGKVLSGNPDDETEIMKEKMQSKTKSRVKTSSSSSSAAAAAVATTAAEVFEEDLIMMPQTTGKLGIVQYPQEHTANAIRKYMTHSNNSPSNNSNDITAKYSHVTWMGSGMHHKQPICMPNGSIFVPKATKEGKT